MKSKWNLSKKNFIRCDWSGTQKMTAGDGVQYIVSNQAEIILHNDNEYSIFDGAVDGIILVCKDGTVIDQLPRAI